MLDPIQNHRFKVLKAITYKSKIGMMEVGETAKEKTNSLNCWVPLKRKVKFLDDSSTEMIYGFRNKAAVAIADYDAYGTLNTHIIGYCQGNATLYYKDP